jgi:hypothetical protein
MTQIKKEKPSDIKELITYLAQLYPNKSLGKADFTKLDRDIWFSAGQRSVVEHLEKLYNIKEK